MSLPALDVMVSPGRLHGCTAPGLLCPACRSDIVEACLAATLLRDEKEGI